MKGLVPADDTHILIPDDAVDVWCSSHEACARCESRLGWLDAVERQRVESIKCPGIQSEFVFTHVFVRDVLARYIGVAPGAVRFTVGRTGKPALSKWHQNAIQFSLSHCGGFAILAVARNRKLGVDVERLDRRVRWDRIAARHFSSSDAAAVHALPHQQRTNAFLKLWTQAEATLKARGGVFARTPRGEHNEWRTIVLYPSGEHVAALVVHVGSRCGLNGIPGGHHVIVPDRTVNYPGTTGQMFARFRVVDIADSNSMRTGGTRRRVRRHNAAPRLEHVRGSQFTQGADQ